MSEFADRVRSFFESHCKLKPTAQTWGEGADSLVGSAFRLHEDFPAEVAEARAFQRSLFDAGLAWLSGPPDLGGAGASRQEMDQYAQIARDYDRPDTNCLHVGQQIAAPAILQFGTEVQRRRWLPSIWRGDLVGCQLFSEPDAGSDLASLRTRAVRDGDGWRIDGQKVWSSGAHVSDFGELLARTDDDPALRHRGLSMFIIDMHTPGVTVRPLRQLNGGSHFCEVYLDNAFIADDRMIGDEGAGWMVAQASLTSERDGFGDEDSHLFVHPYERLVELVAVSGRNDDAVVRDLLADAYTRQTIARLLPEHLAHARPAIAATGASLSKLFSTDTDWRLAQQAATVLGPAITADDGSWGRYAWSQMLLGVAAPRIAGGTDEIQRNILAERCLGLPREPR